MVAVVDPKGPRLAVVPSNPVPQGGRVGYLLTSDRVRLRYGIWRKTGGPSRGTICLVHGRTEFIEKYFETISDFQKRGFTVATFDWRGQGGSERLLRNRKLGYVDTFEDYWCDLKSFHAEVLLPDCPGPFYLVGHSMGGLVCLFAGARDRMMFDRMFLSAPMISVDAPVSIGALANIAGALSVTGLGGLPVRRREDKPPTEYGFANNPLTSDRARYLRTVEVLKADPELEISSPTVGWTAAAARAMRLAEHDSFPNSIRIPVLMLAAARDEVVLSPATESLGLRMRSGRHAVIAAARHELFQESNAIREQVFAAFDAFVTDLTPP